MKILQLSDTHNHHSELTELPAADVIVHCGDFTEYGTEEEVLDFLNWFAGLPYPHKLFVTGNHDLCLWDAEGIENLPEGVHFLQDCGCVIEGVRFFGLAYNHPESLIPADTDVVITHEPPVMILDKSAGTHWGNAPLRQRVCEVKPSYHLFGHAHDAYGVMKAEGTVYSNAALLDDFHRLCRRPRLFMLS